jgi:hypothetical protein
MQFCNRYTGVAGMQAGATAEAKLQLTIRGRRWLRTSKTLRGITGIRNAAGADIVTNTRITIRHKRR